MSERLTGRGSPVASQTRTISSPRERSECWGRWIRPALGPETEGAERSEEGFSSALTSCSALFVVVMVWKDLALFNGVEDLQLDTRLSTCRVAAAGGREATVAPTSVLLRPEPGGPMAEERVDTQTESDAEEGHGKGALFLMVIFMILLIVAWLYAYQILLRRV